MSSPADLAGIRRALGPALTAGSVPSASPLTAARDRRGGPHRGERLVPPMPLPPTDLRKTDLLKTDLRKTYELAARTPKARCAMRTGPSI